MGNEGSKGKKKQTPMDKMMDASYEFKFQAKQLNKDADKLASKGEQEKKRIMAVSLRN